MRCGIYTREKIRAARKKGRYTGGVPPLGYDVDRVNDRLVVSTDEAEVVRRLASDPALVDGVFAEALSQQGDDGERLEAERTRQAKERIQRTETVARLVSYIESGQNGTAAEFKRRIDELNGSLKLIDDRLSAIDVELSVLRRTHIDRGHLEETLRQFTDLWDALYPAERCRLVRSIVSRVIYDRPNGTLRIEFQGPDGRKIHAGESESLNLDFSSGSPNPR